ncbi:hypothetical protein [Streptococcus hyointestinalis]|nr:hypothetical protein [Streptococcus hyointestinalis]
MTVTKTSDLPSEEKERLFMQLKEEICQRVSDVQSGNYYTDDDLKIQYNL